MNQIFYEIFEKLPRVGPGCNQATIRAFNTIRSNKNLKGKLKILDIGCGTGIHTIQLAKLTGGNIIALDKHRGFLNNLESRIKSGGFFNRIECIHGDMNTMNFQSESFDLIWAEGSIFIMGLANGLKNWKRFLKPSGSLALTDVFLFKPDIPGELKTFWEKQYPNILDIHAAEEVIRKAGYRIIDHFPLPQSAWWEDYYIPLEERLVQARRKYSDQPEGLQLIETLQHEIDIYRKYYDCYGYIFFILERA